MKENPVWVEIWRELVAQMREGRADGRLADGGGGLTVVFELAPGTPDFDFVALDDGAGLLSNE